METIMAEAPDYPEPLYIVLNDRGEVLHPPCTFSEATRLIDARWTDPDNYPEWQTDIRTRRLTAKAMH
jgi:hypothetical protein